MAASTLKQLPKSTVELTVTIPWNEVKATYETIFSAVASDTELPGFRKGKAPMDMVKDKIDKKRIYEEVVKEIVPKAYAEALKVNSVSPISSPQVTIKSAKENEPWEFIAVTAIKPIVTLKKYKEKIIELKKGKVKIYKPGDPPAKEGDNKPSLDELLGALVSETEVEVPDILVQDEVNRMLTNLLDQTKKLGLTVEQYLMAKNTTTDKLKAEYTAQAEKNLMLEFALLQVAEEQKITVTPEDIQTVIAKVEKPEDREAMKKDTYYLAHLIRQQKTIDYLSSL